MLCPAPQPLQSGFPFSPFVLESHHSNHTEHLLSVCQVTLTGTQVTACLRQGPNSTKFRNLFAYRPSMDHLSAETVLKNNSTFASVLGVIFLTPLTQQRWAQRRKENVSSLHFKGNDQGGEGSFFFPWQSDSKDSIENQYRFLSKQLVNIVDVSISIHVYL